MKKKYHLKSYIRTTIATALGTLLLFMMPACGQAPTALTLTPTVAPESPAVLACESTAVPTAAIACQEATAVSNLCPTETEAPKVIGNHGSNVENGGLAIYSNSYVYYADNGLYKYETYNEESTKVLDMPNIAYLNDAGDNIYFVDTDGYRVHTYHKHTGEVTPLSIYGAYELLVFGDYLYYQYAIGDEADMHMYRAKLDGSEVTDMGFAGRYFCPDDTFIYFSNMDDAGHLYKYDITTGEIIKVKSDTATQINVLKDKIYYIDQNDDHQVISINKTGAGRELVINDPCVSLNHHGDDLIFTRRDYKALERYNTRDHSLETLIHYADINGITVVDDWVFFEIPMQLEICSGVFRMHLKTSKVFPPLPLTRLVKITDYNADKNSLTVDAVEYLVGDDAIKGYAKEKGVSEARAERRLLESNVNYFVRNKNLRDEQYRVEPYTGIKLYTHDNGTVELSSYAATTEDLFSLLESDPDMVDNLLLVVTTMGNEIMWIEEYRPS